MTGGGTYGQDSKEVELKKRVLFEQVQGQTSNDSVGIESRFLPSLSVLVYCMLHFRTSCHMYFPSKQ